MSPGFSEDSLVEQPAIDLFGQLGWKTARVFDETFGERGTLGRETPHEVVLVQKLRSALAKLNPDLPSESFSSAIEELTR